MWERVDGLLLSKMVYGFNDHIELLLDMLGAYTTQLLYTDLGSLQRPTCWILIFLCELLKPPGPMQCFSSKISRYVGTDWWVSPISAQMAERFPVCHVVHRIMSPVLISMFSRDKARRIFK